MINNWQPYPKPEETLVEVPDTPERLIEPELEQLFFIPSPVRNRLDRFNSKPLFIGFACEMLLRKEAHNGWATIPAEYIRKAYGKRVHEALKELVDFGYVRRSNYIAPNRTSRQWNLENGYIDDPSEYEDEGKACRYRFSKETLAKGKWVIHRERKEDHHHITWNSIFRQQKAGWEKASNLQATEELISALEREQDPDWKVLSLANGRLTFSKVGETLGRRYTTFGTMKSKYRQYFRLQGEEMVELDLSESVFFHLFGSLNAHRKALTNAHGYWNPELTKTAAKNKLVPSGDAAHALHYYDGSKHTTDYRKAEYLDLDRVIEAVSDGGDHGFYEFLQAHMDGIYEHPTRPLAKTQANTWANQESYTTFHGGTNEKRMQLVHRTADTLSVGNSQRKVTDTALSMIFGVNGDRTGCGMMREEARMMLDHVQPNVESTIGTESLAVHDALYVPKSKAEEAKEEMKATYRNEYGIAPSITTE